MQTENNKFLVPLAILVAGVLVAGAIYFGDKKGSTSYVQEPTIIEAEIIPLKDSDHILGDRSAPVIVIEYSDTECPFCKIFHKTMLQIVEEYDGKVAWVYRHFPIPQLHTKAIKEAEATECASELGGNDVFWQYINRLFEITNSNDSLDLAELPRIAEFVGLDRQAFDACLQSGRHLANIEASANEAVRAGAEGTPYSIILKGDKKITINGAEPISMVRAKIDALLNEN